MGRVDPVGVQRPRIRSFDLPLQIPSSRAGRLEARIKEICQTRVRYGYRRVHVLLRREGWEINLKRTHRIYNELALQLRNTTPKRRVKAKLRDDRRAASTSNDVWAMDLVHDQLATGQKIRVLTVVDLSEHGCGKHVRVLAGIFHCVWLPSQIPFGPIRWTTPLSRVATLPLRFLPSFRAAA
jgi:hypothetical protein